MDRYQKRHRRRQILDNSTDMHRMSTTSSFKTSDSDDEYYYYSSRHRQRKEYCLIKIAYRKQNSQRHRRFDEIMVIENHRIIFKGCLCEGDEFTLKCQRYENQSKIKLKFYINDLLDDEIISCCAYGFIHRNRPKHLFHIEEVIGAKPCYDCEFNETLLKTTNSNSSRKSCELDEKTVESSTKVKLQRQKSESDNETKDTVAPIPEKTRRTYGPPQLSTLASINESIDLPQTRSSHAVTPAENDRLFNSAAPNNQTESLQRSELSPNETNSSDTIVRVNPMEMSIADAAVQLLLSQLGIVRQEQIEHPESPIASRSREKGNVEYLTLIYLHETNPDESIVQHLRSLVNFVKIFNDIDDCIAFINTVDNERLVVIISKTFYQSIISRIEDLQQIFSIYILSDEDIEQTTTSKIRGTYTDMNEIYKSIALDVEHISMDSTIYLSVCSRATTIESSTIYYLILNEILLHKQDEKYQLTGLISLARREYEGNESELEIIDEFEKTYKKNQAIHWYSRTCFLSKMLNKALAAPEPDILYHYRFFIQDLYEQIQNESTDDIRFVYLGQTIKRTDLDSLQENMQTADTIILPQFLFATTDQEHAMELARQLPLLSDEIIPIVICLEIPEGFNCVRQQNETDKVLLTFNHMYRLTKVDKNLSMPMISVCMIKSDEQDAIQDILDITRKEVASLSTFVSIVKLMIANNQQISGEQFTQCAFDDETVKDNDDFQAAIALAAHLLAVSRRNQDNYQLALQDYLLSLKAFQRILPATSTELSSVHSNVGAMYFRLEDYPRSLEHFLKALEIQLQSTTPDLLAVSIYTKSLGTIYTRLRNYPAAINSFLRTIRVLEQLPDAHYRELMATYDELGDIYYVDQKVDEALASYVKAAEYQEKIIPRNPEGLGKSYHTIGNLYLKRARSKEALKYLKLALEYFQEVYPPNHASFALLNNNIGLMYYRENQYDEALQYYARALAVAAVSLPENHTLPGITMFNIALIYTAQEKFDEAIENLENSTKQFLKSLPEDAPDVVENQKYLETIRQKKILKDIFDGNITSFQE